MATTKISMPCEPCEPLREPFKHNGSHANPLKSIENNVLVNDVNHLHARARVEEILFSVLPALKTHKKLISLTREKSKKSFTSFTFFKNAHKALILNMKSCEPFFKNHSQFVHIIHIF